MLNRKMLLRDFNDPEERTRAAPLLVLGIGNRLLSDDGVGPVVIDRLSCSPNCEIPVDYLDGGTLSFTLMNEIESHSALIVIDACELHAEPGTIRMFEGAAMDLHMRSGRRSVHEVALSDLLDIARLRDCLPERRALFGVQPTCVSWGLALTDPVEKAAVTVCDHVEALVKRWRS